MLYIILIIIAIFIYLIYKQQKSPKISISKTGFYQVKIKQMMEQKEATLLNLIKTNPLKDYMQTEVALFDCGRKNFICLCERFKYDNIKFAQIVKDWIDYMDILKDVVFQRLYLDVSKSITSADICDEKIDNLFIKIKEINKRLQDLLGNEYMDPKKFI